MKEYLSYFNLDDDVTYMNHAAVAPWPCATVQAVQDFASENGRMGSRHYSSWLSKESQLREQLCQLINAPAPEQIALLKNTSEGLSLIAYGLSWQVGDQIVIAAEEFPSNRLVWESLADQGVDLVKVDLQASTDPEQALLDAMNEHTRLLSISAVQYSSGLRMDLVRLSQGCREREVLLCVDGIQQIGALQFDVQKIQADFVVADGHKWMLGPEGLALFWCRPKLYPQLRLLQYGWHMMADLSDFNTMNVHQPATTAQRFECGSPNMLSIHALSASIGVLQQVGMAEVEQQLLERVQYLIQLYQVLPDIQILSPQEKHRHAGIFTFKHNMVSSEILYQHLVSQGVVCALRGGGIRLSPHFYTPQQKLDQVAALTRGFIQSRA